MTHSVALIVAETVRTLSATSPFHCALIRELGADRAAQVIARALDSLTTEERRVALMAGAAGQAQLAADVIRHDAVWSLPGASIDAIDALSAVYGKQGTNGYSGAPMAPADLDLEQGGEYDRGADLLGNAAGFLRQATGAYPSRVEGAEVFD